MRKITWEDLTESGPVIQMLFAGAYPDGLTEEEMAASDRGWVRRAFDRWREARENG